MRTNARLTSAVDIVTDYYPDPNSKLGLMLPIVKRITHTTPATKTGDSATLRVYERRIEIKCAGVQPPHLRGLKRGVVSLEFTGKARKRMISALHQWRIPSGQKLYFVTLTYPSQFPTDWQSWKADLEKFRRVLLDKFHAVQGFWRLELQRRGAPHYHLVIALPQGLITNRSIYRWVRVQWARIAHQYDQYNGDYATRVDVMDRQSAIYKYISKYVSKPGGVPIDPDGVILQDEDADNAGGMGRHWGKIGKPSTDSIAEIDMLGIAAIDQLKQVVIGWLRRNKAYYAEYLAGTPPSISWDCVGIPGHALLLMLDELLIGKGLLPHERARVLSTA